jgi:hypothetical protein
MSLFLTENEKSAFHDYRKQNPLGQDLFWALLNRTEARARHPGLTGPEGGAEWWFCAAEYLSDAAMAHALKPSASLAAWLRNTTLDLGRRPESDWVGPPFRPHAIRPVRGNLETAHLTWGVAVALDLAGDIFTEAEREEIRATLRDRAIPLCREWLANNNHLANWRCILGAGEAVAAAVLDDREAMQRAVREYRISLQIFQDDGSYGESLQYSNYPALHLLLAREALVRRDPSLAGELPTYPWNLLPRWYAASLFYVKPLGGRDAAPRARCANFNDSSAIFRPSGDLLLALAAREKDNHPREAGLARWIYDTLYAPDLAVGPHDGASFGFANDWGFLSPVFLPEACAAFDPEAAGLATLETFDNGDVLVRDTWRGRTTLAIHGGGEPLHGPGHLHGDLNSFILVHNRERLLADPGHSCYRNLIHELEGSTLTHNTCTFTVQDRDDLGLQEDKHARCDLQQSRQARAHFDRATGRRIAGADRGARGLLAARLEDLTVVGSEAAALYGPPIERFARFWILCGSHALFVVDQIQSARPVQVAWHWLLNNRDGLLEHKVIHPDRAVARRPGAGLKLFHLGSGLPGTPEYAYVHDAYNPRPAGLGEGRPGSGLLLTWREPAAAAQTARTTVHAIAMDGYGAVAGWHLTTSDGQSVLESPGGKERWAVETGATDGGLLIRDLAGDRAWSVRPADDGRWSLAAGS